MKLDKIKFANLMMYLGRTGAFTLNEETIQTIDDLIDTDVPAVSSELVDELLRQMALGNKISAAKAYRELCHAGLRKSEDAVEKYWTFKGQPIASEANLGDILAQATRK